VPAEPKRELDIFIESGRHGVGTKMQVRDVTPVPPPDLPDQAARLKAAGLTPDGRLADPQHLQ